MAALPSSPTATAVTRSLSKRHTRREAVAGHRVRSQLSAIPRALPQPDRDARARVLTFLVPPAVLPALGGPAQSCMCMGWVGETRLSCS